MVHLTPSLCIQEEEKEADDGAGEGGRGVVAANLASARHTINVFNPQTLQ